MVVGCRSLGVDCIDCRLYLLVVVVCFMVVVCQLSSADCRMSGVSDIGCCLSMVSWCRLLVVGR